MGSRPHRGLRGAVARAPARRPAADAAGAGGHVRRVRDAARRARRPAAARPRAGARLPRRRARPRPGGGLVPARPRGPPRGPAPGDDAAGDRDGPPLPRSRRAARGAAGGARRPHGPRVRRGPGRAVRARRAGGPLRLRQRAPAPPRRAARLPDRPHADHQRDLPALRRGRRLQAPPVVEPRGVGLEGGVRHHTPRGLGRRAHGLAPLDVRRLGADRPGRARGPRLLVRGRRPRPSARGTAALRGGVGEGGDLEPGSGTRQPRPRAARPGAGGRLPGGRGGVRRARHARRRVGVDVDARSAAIPASSPTRTASTRRSSSATATGCCAAARGPLARAWRARPSATGTCRTGGRSSRE